MFCFNVVSKNTECVACSPYFPSILGRLPLRVSSMATNRNRRCYARQVTLVNVGAVLILEPMSLMPQMEKLHSEIVPPYGAALLYHIRSFIEL